MRRVLCFIGIHQWVHHVNREKEGRDKGWDVCSRCRHEKHASALEGGIPSFKGDGGHKG